MRDGKVCEHCLLGIVMISFYGNFRVYECEKGIEYEPKDWLAGFSNPCEGFHCGTGKRGEKWTPTYKRILMSQMRKSKSCIEDEKKEAEKRRKEAEELRKEALILIRKADALEKP